MLWRERADKPTGHGVADKGCGAGFAADAGSTATRGADAEPSGLTANPPAATCGGGRRDDTPSLGRRPPGRPRRTGPSEEGRLSRSGPCRGIRKLRGNENADPATTPPRPDETVNATPAPMTVDQAKDAVEAFERRHRVFADLCQGVSLWRLVRFEVMTELTRGTLYRRPPERAALLAGSLQGARTFLLPPRHAAYVCKTYASALRREEGGRWLDIHFDDLLRAVPGGVKMCSYDAGGYREQLRRALIAPRIDETGILVASAILGRIPPPMADRLLCGRLSERIRTELGLASFTPARLQRKASTFRWRRRLFRGILRRVRPHAILVPNTGQFALLAAAQDLGIRFIELQHGLFGADHPDALPDFALDMAEPRALLLPDRVALYSPYWQARLAGTAVATLGRLAIAGRPGTAPVAAGPGDDGPVLVTAQGIEGERLAALLAGALRAVPDGVRLIVKLHPTYGEDRETFERHLTEFADRVTILDGTGKPATEALLAACSVHVSISSACHYDALMIGRPTIVIALPSHESVLDLVARGDAYRAATGEELAGLLRSRPWRAGAAGIGRDFRSPDFVESMRSLVLG